MNTTWKTVRVFISSTFRDMQAERDHLVRFVFPRLRGELLKRRIHLIDVDLRWGVTSELDALTVCREIIDECRPHFLCILGGRYGWVPPGKTHSITADEVYYGVLDRALKDRGFAAFYFRAEAATAAMAESIRGEFREPSGSDAQRKLGELKQAIIAAGLNPFTYTAQWDNEGRRLTGLGGFGARVFADLLASMKADPDMQDRFLTDTAVQLGEFDEENAAMEAFVEERSERFVLGSREAVLNDLLAHASAIGGNGYVCLTGAPGSGKSALLAHLSRHPTLNNQTSTLCIPHFIGASPGSTDLRRTLRRLCHALKAGCPDITADIPDASDKLWSAFPTFLQQACARRRVVILLDAVNQFDPTSHFAGLHWLPESLPANARIILSALDGPALEELRRSPRRPREIELGPLSAADGEAIIDQFRQRHRKQFEPDQRAALLGKIDAGTPLYLLAALEELRTLGTFEEITRRITELPPTAHELFAWILERLGNDDGFRDAEGRPVGRALVSRFAQMLGASRYGLSQRELADLLEAGDPQGNVAALLHLLRPYLMRRGELLDFYHGQFRAAAEEAWLRTDAQRQAAHAQLAGYFAAQPLWSEGDLVRASNSRKVSELPFHQARAKCLPELQATLTDLDFIEAKCSARMSFALIQDYHRVGLGGAGGPLLLTAHHHQGRSGIQCPECLASFEVREDQLGQAIACPACRTALRLNPFPLALEWQASPPLRASAFAPSEAEGAFSSDVEEWAGFVTAKAHVLQRYPALTFQEAHNWTEGSAPVRAAEARWKSRMENRPWLRRTCDRGIHDFAIATMTGHRGAVISCAVSPDGRRVVSGSSDCSVKMWDARTGAELRTLADGIQGPWWCGFSPDGQKLGVCGDREVRTLDVESGAGLTRQTHNRNVLGAAWTPLGFWLAASSFESGHAGGNYRIEVWDVETGDSITVVHGEDALRCSFSPDGLRMLTWGRMVRGPGSRYTHIVGSFVQLWDLGSGKELARQRREAPSEPRCVYLPDGRRIASLASIRAVRFFSAETGEEVARIDAESRPEHTPPNIPSWYIDNLMSASDADLARTSEFYVERTDQHLFVGGYNNAIKLLRADHLEEISTAVRQSEELLDCACSPDGRYLIGLPLSDRTIRVWETETGEPTGTLAGHSGSLRTAAFFPDGQRIVSGAEDSTLRIWKVATQGKTGRPNHSDAIVACAFSADGSHIVTGSKDRTTRLWDTSTGHMVARVGHSREVSACAVSGDGRRIVSWASTVYSDEEGECLVVEGMEWDADSRSQRALDGAGLVHDDQVHCCTFLQDGHRHLSISAGNGVVTLWESGQARVLFSAGHSVMANHYMLSADGRFLVFCTEHDVYKLLDLDSLEGPCVHAQMHIYAVFTEMSSGGGRIVTALGEGLLKSWDAQTGDCLRTLSGDWGSVTACAFSHDGRHFVTVSGGSEVKVWDAETGLCLASRAGLADGVYLPTFSADGRHIITISRDATLRVWRAQRLDQVAILAAPRSITAVAVSPTSGTIAAGDAGGSLYLLKLEEP